MAANGSRWQCRMAVVSPMARPAVAPDAEEAGIAAGHGHGEVGGGDGLGAPLHPPDLDVRAVASLGRRLVHFVWGERFMRVKYPKWCL
jgi:hypothetical protein